MDMVIEEEVAAAFALDGVVCIRSVLDEAQVAVAAAAIDAVLARPGPLAQVGSSPDDPGAFTEDFCRWQQVPAIEQLARQSRVPAVAAALLGTAQLRFYHDHVLVKEGGTRQRTPWHQDQPYYAPGPALLQRGRPRRQRLDSGRSGAGRRLPGTGSRHSPRPLAAAAHLP